MTLCTLYHIRHTPIICMREGYEGGGAIAATAKPVSLSSSQFSETFLVTTHLLYLLGYLRSPVFFSTWKLLCRQCKNEVNLVYENEDTVKCPHTSQLQLDEFEGVWY